MGYSRGTCALACVCYHSAAHGETSPLISHDLSAARRAAAGAAWTEDGEHGMRRRSLPFLLGGMLVVLLAQAGCAAQETVTIAGTVLGDSLNASISGATDPIAATVTCNGI